MPLMAEQEGELLESRWDVAVGVGWEYSSLRAEVLQRIQHRYQILSVTLTIAGVFLGVGLNTHGIALVYPPLAMFLAEAWVQNDNNILQIVRYVRQDIESTVPGLGWETHMESVRQKRRHGWRRTVVAHGGVFVITQVLALVLGVVQMVDTLLADDLSVPLIVVNVVLIAVAVFAIWRVLCIMRQAQR